LVVTDGVSPSISGWTQAGTTQTAFGSFSTAVFYRVAAAGEGTSYTLSVMGGSNHGGYIIAMRSVAQVAPYEGNVAFNAGSGTTATALGITTGAENSIAVILGVANNPAATWTPATGYT
jgi:hypothetical protein